LRTAARDRNFLLGVLDHIAADKPLLIAFAGHIRERPLRDGPALRNGRSIARRRLPTALAEPCSSIMRAAAVKFAERWSTPVCLKLHERAILPDRTFRCDGNSSSSATCKGWKKLFPR
jgi:Protein of unknown function (DUF3572)